MKNFILAFFVTLLKMGYIFDLLIKDITIIFINRLITMIQFHKLLQ